MRFKLKLLMLLAGVLIFSTPLSAWALHLGTTTAGHPTAGVYATEDVRNTLHNLGLSISGFTNPNLTATAANTNEVCVFCHTPHGANTNAPGAAPLWNRSVPSTAAYTVYNSPNFDSTANLPQGVSLACLSCHDGTIALDALINAGGSGGFSGTINVGAGGGTRVQPGGGTALITAGGLMNPSPRTDTGPNYGSITGGAVPFPNLTQNLSDDHPISMLIPDTGGGCAGFGANTDPQFDELCNSSGTVMGKVLRLQRTASDYPADRRDAIRAYPPPATSDITAGTFIECASCHNPHAPRPLFLRLPSAPGVGTNFTSNDFIPAAWGGSGTEKWGDNPNKGSAICLSCHQK